MLNDRQRKFCEYYAACGNGAEAARRAGYSPKTARTQASELLTNPDILAYVQELREKSASARVATLVELRAFWSDTFYDTTQKMGDRLKSSELLAKSLGAFMAIHLDDGGVGERGIAGACDGEDVLIVLPDNGRDPGVCKNYIDNAFLEKLKGENEDAG